MDFSGEMADEILKIFQVESEEIITRLNANILELEKKPNDKDVVLLLFRDAHTLKGASRMVGFTNVQTISHKLEDILGLAKESKIQINSKLIDILYKTTDFLSELIQKSIEAGKEIYTEEIPKKISVLEQIENESQNINTEETVQIDFNSGFFTQNVEKINENISEILFLLMSLELSDNSDSIQKLLHFVTDLYEIFKEINHYEIKKELEDIKVKLEFISKASNKLTNSEVDELQQKIDDIISKLIPIYELYNQNLVDYYTIAFEKMSKNETLPVKKEIKAEKKEEKPTVETPLESENPKEEIQIQPQGSEELEYINKLISDLAQGKSSVEQIQNSIEMFAQTHNNPIIDNISKKIIEILDYTTKNELNPDEETISVITQSLQYCEDVLENRADKASQELLLQRLTIVQQVLEINQTQKEDKKFVTKSSFKIKNKLNDISRIYNTGDIKTLRVDSEKLDTLINQVNELTVRKIKTQKHLKELGIIHKELEDWQKTATKAINYLKYYDKKYFQSAGTEAPISFFIKQLLTVFDENNKTAQEASTNISSLQRTIQEDDGKMNIIVENLSNMVKDIRILPLATVFHLFGRMVRDIAQEKKKKIDLEILGSETSTDKKIIEEIKSPLIHIIRNAIDHGIETPEERIALGKNETGKIILSARQKGNKVIIEIKDDGRGINVQKVKEKALEKGFLTQEEINSMTDEQITNIIFAPGFSTGEEITNISGRGIGLDVVQSKIAQLNGKVKMISETNKGCCVQIELPTTMSTIKAFLVKSAGQTFAIPMDAINTVMRKNSDEIIYNKNKKSIIFEEKTISLMDLAELLDLKQAHIEKSKETIIILEVDNKIMAISVDKLIGDQEILHKKLSAPLYKLKNISGLTTLASGDTCLILNISDIIKTADKLKKKTIATKATKQALPLNSYKILLVDDSITTRTLEKNILQKAGYSIEVAQNPIEAFEKMQNIKFDLIISDVEMPEMNGFEFLEKIKSDEQYADIPVIMVSSLISEEYKKLATQLKAEKYIIKGEFEQDSFQEMIKQIIKGTKS